ncbi:MAG: hypothetical protein QNL91_04340 [Candidatus Krumholzibacteria bacterium]|nr:hypothetical protein [Candidatus Krumholzibacteria bacterium]
MSLPKNNPLLIASLLAVAALLCLGLALRLLAVSGDILPSLDPAADTRLTTVLTIGGGIVIFLFGTISLLAARRYAMAAGRNASREPEAMKLVDVRQWSQELTDLRDDLRRDLEQVTANPEWEFEKLTIPASFRPSGQYLLDEVGQATDPLADLKRTRDHLLEAAERVDNIVQSVNESISSGSAATGSPTRSRHWFFWWRSP